MSLPRVLNGVALFTRAWIEIMWNTAPIYSGLVALFTRAWIEIILYNIKYLKYNVALFTRAWIEITDSGKCECINYSRPLHEGVD